MSNRTYRKLFEHNPGITSFGKWRLPRGWKITRDGIIAYLICLIPAYFFQPVISGLCAICTGRQLWKPVTILGLALGGVILFNKIDANGKPIHVFVRDVVKYFMRPHGTNGWAPIRIRKKPINATIKAKCITRHTPPQC